MLCNIGDDVQTSFQISTHPRKGCQNNYKRAGESFWKGLWGNVLKQRSE